MKRRIVLVVSVFSIFFVALMTSVVIDGVNLTDKEVQKYVNTKRGVPSIVETVNTKGNEKEYIVKDTENKLQFTVFVDTSSYFPEIIGDNYDIVLKEVSYSNRIVKHLKNLPKDIGFSYTENPIYLSLSDNKEVPVFKTLYKGNLTMFGFQKEEYKDLYSLIERVNKSEIEDIFIDVEGTEGGRIMLGNLTTLKSPDDVQSRIADLFIIELDKQDQLEKEIKSILK